MFKKAQRTSWKFTALYRKGTFMRVGFMFNKNRNYKEDVIRLQIKSVNHYWDLEMTLDEAVVIASGLTKVAGQMLSGHICHGEYKAKRVK